MSRFFHCIAVTFAIALLACPSLDADEKAESKEKEPVLLTIGSNAPQLDIEHWIQDGKGHFSKVTEFEADKVYIVEFWATWCGPCIAAMPHIVELQGKYAKRGVQIVSITREDRETVEKFLERKVAGENPEGKTYRDLTSAYCLTADPDQSSSRDYMLAAKRTGIPCAFIVGKDAKIEWIGHPMSIDQPLEQVVTDQWDRDAFMVKYKAEQEAQAVMQSVQLKMRSGEIVQAVEILDDYIANGTVESEKARFRAIKLQVLFADKELAKTAPAYARELLGDKTLEPSFVNAVAWNLFRLSAAGQFEDKEVLQVALTRLEKTVEKAGDNKPFVLDTIAHLHHHLGNLEAAIKTQTEAVELAKPSSKARLGQFLTQLQQEATAPEESTEEK